MDGSVITEKPPAAADDYEWAREFLLRNREALREGGWRIDVGKRMIAWEGEFPDLVGTIFSAEKIRARAASPLDAYAYYDVCPLTWLAWRATNSVMPWPEGSYGKAGVRLGLTGSVSGLLARAADDPKAELRSEMMDACGINPKMRKRHERDGW